MWNIFKKQRHTIILQSAAQWTTRDYVALAKEGYEKNVIVYRCINLIAKSIASVPLLLYKGDHEITQHPIKQRLNRPNRFMSYHAFMESLVTFYLLSGNAYIYHDADELFLLRPDRVQVATDDKGYPHYYRYQVGAQHADYPAASVLHIKSLHPTDDRYGLSPIEAAAYAIDQHNAVAQHNLALLQNGGRPSGALMLENELSPEQKEELDIRLKEFCEGARNAGRVLLLEGQFKWEEMGLSPKDLDFLPGKSVSAREIASAFGVSPILVGLTEDASFNNYKEARLQFWEDTVVPLLQRFLEPVLKIP